VQWDIMRKYVGAAEDDSAGSGHGDEGAQSPQPQPPQPPLSSHGAFVEAYAAGRRKYPHMDVKSAELEWRDMQQFEAKEMAKMPVGDERFLNDTQRRLRIRAIWAGRRAPESGGISIANLAKNAVVAFERQLRQR